MSQQEFMPQSQNPQSQRQDEPHTPAPWSAKRRSGDILKEEHPSTFEASLPEYGYQAQEGAAYTRRQAHPVQETQAQRRQRFSPDGDAFEYGYRPRNQYSVEQQAPPWARPQRHRKRGILFWILLIVLALVLVKALPLLIGLIIAIIGVVAFAVLLPIFIILAILAVFAAIALVVLAALGIPLFGWLRSRSYPRRGRPWNW